MPNPHDLFDAATDGLPPLPDLAPSVRRVVRRRQLAARTTAAVLSSALAIGAGTFALSAQHSGRAQDAASQTPHTYSNQCVLDTLRSIWPVKGQKLALDPTSPYAIVITRGGHTVGRMFFEVNPDINSFPGILDCPAAGTAGLDCLKGTAPDGDRVLAAQEPMTTLITVGTAPAGLGRTTSPTPPSPSLP